MASRSAFVTILLALGFAAAGQEPIQLDDACTVTVGNQTVFIRPDGTYLVRNISIFQSRDTGVAPQLYRVRATCLRGGEMITGQSDFFPLTPGRTRFVGDVFPSELDPIPLQISANAPADFVPLGATVQLSVLATLPDGGSEDVTPRAAGTTYLSTNPNLLTVSEDGLVTGVNNSTTPQTGTIAILNEGNLATINFTAVGPSNDFDNDGMPNDYEELFGLNPFVNDANGDLDGDGLRNIDEFNLGTLPNNPDTDLDGIPDGIDGDPLHPEEAPPTVAITLPLDGATLFEGQTIQFTVDASDDGLLTGVEFLVNGVSFASLTEPPFELTFTVPYAATTLQFDASATDSVGNVGTAAATVASVTPDPLTAVQGVVVDRDANPVAGADVSLRLNGLKGEFFDFDVPLTSLPDLTGLTPDVTKLVSAINLRNPDDLLSIDTFGVALAPDFAARFTGFIRIPTAGSYTFTLGVDDGARLTIDGALVAEVVATGDFTEGSGTIVLPATALPIEIDYFQAVGDAELQLSSSGPGGVIPEIVPPADLLQSPDTFAAVTDDSGLFALSDVPTILGDVRAEATATIGGRESSGSAVAAPVPGGITDVGEIRLTSGIAIVHTNPGNAQSVKDLLVASGSFEADEITLFDALRTTVTLADLSESGAVLVYTNFSFPNPDAFGDVLADYVEQGGGVVLATYVYSQPWRIGGRILEPGFSPFAVSAARFRTSGTLDLNNSDAGHPILEGVNSASYFVNSNYTNPPLTDGATLVARDTNGNNLIAVNAANDVVGISIFPGFLASQGTGDVVRIFVNALTFVR